MTPRTRRPIVEILTPTGTLLWSGTLPEFATLGGVWGVVEQMHPAYDGPMWVRGRVAWMH